MMPEKIGKYIIKREIARGGMATVYEAFDPVFERNVALKVLPPEFLHDETFRARFDREAKTVASIESVVIVPVYDYGEADGRLYLAMRYMSAGSLAERLNGTPMATSEIVRLFNRLAPGLDRAHARGIVHRDLKPANVLFDDAGEPFLSDFGIAKTAMSRSDLTRSQVIGTPAYMSPEQARGEPLDGRSDLYALGAMLYEMLTGKLPFNAENPTGIMLKHVMDPIPRILASQLGLSPDWQRIIDRSMAKRPDDRYSVAATLAADIQAAYEGRPLSMDTPVSAPPPMPSSTAFDRTVEFRPPTASAQPVYQPPPIGGATMVQPPAPQVQPSYPMAAGATMVQPPAPMPGFSQEALNMPIPMPIPVSAGGLGAAPPGTGSRRPIGQPPEAKKKSSALGIIAMIAAIVVVLACLATIVSVVLNPAMRATLPFLPQDATPTSIAGQTVVVPTVDLSVLTAKPPTVSVPGIGTPTPSAPRTPQGGKVYLPIIFRTAKP
ncbi:MAG TPA: protein kinase [Thermoflexales bacterium]|nr:protein kinase [Anaerolineae bacterium]HQV29381.1 protein kinase [Thermoflexales bacterium]HQX09138.1 protein kinase [Thermoflexales bacterium]HQZ52852.1 protein kinase [Thermoflexales bacterium]